MTTEKLPEWPEKPVLWAMPRERDYYANRLAYAALARMEALAEVVNAHYWAIVKDVTTETPAQAHQRLHALLAACERKEAGR